MNVNLISKTDNILQILYTACKTCTSNESPINTFNDININCDIFTTSDCGEYCGSKNCPIFKNDAKALKLIKKVIDSGHHSILEHINFTFTIDDISRACSHQLVRHRIGIAFSQKSQRCINNEDEFCFNYITPESIINSEYQDMYDSCMVEIQDTYSKLLEIGIPQEDARFVLPSACSTSFTMTINLRQLIHICNERLCNRSQWEIRELFIKIKDIIINDEEWLADYLVPKCVRDGKCNEVRSCKDEQ